MPLAPPRPPQPDAPAGAAPPTWAADTAEAGPAPAATAAGTPQLALFGTGEPPPRRARLRGRIKELLLRSARAAAVAGRPHAPGAAPASSWADSFFDDPA